jgi:hypothetical protein
VTLVGQGLLLPWVIRALGLANAGRRELQADRIEERRARRSAVETAIERFDQWAAERSLSEPIVKPLRAAQHARLAHIDLMGDDAADSGGALAGAHDEIELELIAAERQLINDLFRDGKLKDEARRRIERELDLREARLANQRDQD